MCNFFPMKESYSAVASLVRFKVYVERAQEDATNGWKERGRQKTLTQHITWSGRQGEASRERRGGGLEEQEREREMARGHPWVICFGPLRAQTHREQVNQLQCDMNH